MANNAPRNLQELFDFYYQHFKPLYNHLAALNTPPTEMFFELNAAWDHLSRRWKYGEEEAKAVDAACRHLKRGCFDAFKIVARNTRDHYIELQKIDASLIDNGEFEKRMISLMAKIESGAITARMAEGDSRDENNWHHVFDLWEQVYGHCIEFDEEFHRSSKVEWARKKQGQRLRKEIWRNRVEGLVIGIIASLVVWWLTSCLF
jgi:hypothetical protein